MEASAGKANLRRHFVSRITYIPGQTGQTFAVAEVAQQSPAGQQSPVGQQTGQQLPSGQHESLATWVAAQHAPSGQQAPSGQHEDSVAKVSEPDSEKAATVPVTSNANATTPLAIIFVIIDLSPIV